MIVFKPSLPPFSLIKTKTLSDNESDNALVKKLELRTEMLVFPREIDVHMNKNESQAKKVFVFFFGFMLAWIQ